MSIMISELEKDLEVTLINRSTRSTELTEAGREFYEQIRGSIDQIEKAYAYADAAGKAEHGRLRIATLTSLAAGVVTEAIAKLHADRPGIQIQLMERSYSNFLQTLRQREVDLGVGILRGEHADLKFQFLYSDQLIIVTPKGHPLMSPGMSIKDVSKYDVVMVTPGASLEALQQQVTNFVPRIQVEQPSTAIAMVRKGLGVTITSSSATASLDMRDLAAAPVPGTKRDIGIITLADAKLSPAGSAFQRCMLTIRHRPSHPCGPRARTEPQNKFRATAPR
jgi:DNA-binding transcriptional LysR family regulator